MTAQELLDAYTAYLAQNRLLRLPMADSSVARLYGTEEVHLGAGGKISFEGLPGVVAT